MADSGKLLKRIVFGTAGTLLIAIAIAWGIDIRQFARKAAVAQGIVMRLNHGGSHPQIRFVDKDGKTVEYAQNGLIFGYQPGEKVRVLYTSDARQIDTFGALYGFTLLLLVMGLAFTVAAFGRL